MVGESQMLAGVDKVFSVCWRDLLFSAVTTQPGMGATEAKRGWFSLESRSDYAAPWLANLWGWYGRTSDGGPVAAEPRPKGPPSRRLAP
jgi:hypothetical protein